MIAKKTYKSPPFWLLLLSTILCASFSSSSEIADSEVKKSSDDSVANQPSEVVEDSDGVDKSLDEIGK